jgi:hypothetical protein
MSEEKKAKGGSSGSVRMVDERLREERVTDERLREERVTDERLREERHG